MYVFCPEQGLDLMYVFVRAGAELNVFCLSKQVLGLNVFFLSGHELDLIHFVCPSKGLDLMYLFARVGAGFNVFCLSEQGLNLMYCLSEQGLDLMYVFVPSRGWT